MDESLKELQSILMTVLARYCAQVGADATREEQSRVAQNAAALVAERGLPPPLRRGEMGTPGSMSDEELAPLVSRALAGIDQPDLADAARQLVKTCFYPEFKVCRDSFREVRCDGSCRRQELERARSRISGSHCVDCPHWVALEPAKHARFLSREWRGDRSEFAAHQAVFLPEDFRALRLWLHAARRRA